MDAPAAAILDTPAATSDTPANDDLEELYPTIRGSQILPNPAFMEMLNELDLGNTEVPAMEASNGGTNVENVVNGVWQQGESSVNLSVCVPTSLPAITDAVHYEEDTSVPSSSILKDLLEGQKSLPAPVSPIPDSQPKTLNKSKNTKSGKRQVKRKTCSASKPVEKGASVQTGSAMLPKRRAVRKRTPTVNLNNSESESEFLQPSERAGPSNAALPAGVRNSSPAVSESDSESDEFLEPRTNLFKPFYNYYIQLKRDIAGHNARMLEETKARKSALGLIRRGQELLRKINERHKVYDKNYKKKVKEVNEMEKMLNIRN